MATFLFKTEPDDYSWDDLEREGRAPWDGVRNAQAQMHLRDVRQGDEILIYHTGAEKAVVGLATVTRGPYPDPEVPGTTAAGVPRCVLVDLKPVRRCERPVRLRDLRQDDRFKDFLLLRNSRLSVMPVPPELDAVLRDSAGL